MGVVKCRGTCTPVSLVGREQGDVQPRVPVPTEASSWPGPRAVPREAVFDIPASAAGAGAECDHTSVAFSGTRWPSLTLRGCPHPLPVPLTPQDPGMGMELGAEPYHEGRAVPTCTITSRPCQDLSYPQVTREPPDGCPQQLRSLPCLCVGALSPQASLHPQELKGIHRWGSGGGNSKSTGAVGLLMVGPQRRAVPSLAAGKSRAPARGDVSRYGQ